MPTMSADDARDLARQFAELAHSIGLYRLDNWKKLTPKQRAQLESAQWSVLNTSSDLSAQAIGLTLDDLERTLAEITKATKQLTTVIGTLKDIQKALKVAAAAAGLAAAIATGNASALGASLLGLKDFLS